MRLFAAVRKRELDETAGDRIGRVVGVLLGANFCLGDIGTSASAGRASRGRRGLVVVALTTTEGQGEGGGDGGDDEKGGELHMDLQGSLATIADHGTNAHFQNGTELNENVSG